MLTVTFCTCESKAETPSYTQASTDGVYVCLIGLLMFECQVSAQDFSAALGMLGDTPANDGMYCTVAIAYVVAAFYVY